MEEGRKGQEDNRTLSEVMDDIGNLFDQFVEEWNKLVKMQKENLEVFNRIKRGQI